jgi:HPt (histidine-containing phosphotransfer) domain-containing protein
MGGSKRVYIRAARAFLEALPTQVDALVHQGNSGSVGEQSTAAMAHTLKGLAATMGAVALAQVAASIEALAKAHATAEQLELATLQLQHIARVTRDALGAALDALDDAHPRTASSGTEPPQSRSAAIAAISKLVQLLEGNDLEALAHYASIQGTLGHVAPELQEALEQALQGLELADALKICRDIQAQDKFNAGGGSNDAHFDHRGAD